MDLVLDPNDGRETGLRPIEVPPALADHAFPSRWMSSEFQPDGAMVDAPRCPAWLKSAIDEHCAVVLRGHYARLDREALALLAEGVPLDEMVVVYSPLWSDGRVVTRDQEREHEAELRRKWPT